MNAQPFAFPSSPSFPDLENALELLETGDFQARWDAVKQISEEGHRAIAPLLTILHNTSDWELQWFIVRILGNLHQPQTIPVLVALIQADHADVAGMAAIVLASFEALAIAPLTTLLEQESTQLLAVQALAQIHHPQAIAPLLHLAETGGDAARAVAIEALGHFHDVPEILPVLLAALKSPVAMVRRAAVVGLGFQVSSQINSQINSQVEADWIGQLQLLLYDLNLDVAQQTAIALGRIATPEAVIALNQALLSAVPVADEIIRSLARVGTEMALDGLQTYLTQENSQHHLEILTVLGRVEQSQKRATAILLSALAHPVITVREKQAIALSLGQLGQIEALEALIQLLADADAGVQFHAIAALKQLAPQVAWERLKELAASENASPALQRGVAIALREWGYDELP